MTEQVIKDKGGMGLTVETENKKKDLSFFREQIHKENMDRLQRLEDAVVLMKRQGDFVTAQMEKLEERVGGWEQGAKGNRVGIKAIKKVRRRL